MRNARVVLEPISNFEATNIERQTRHPRLTLPEVHVALDANAYRSLSKERFERLMAPERRKSVVTKASYTAVS